MIYRIDRFELKFVITPEQRERIMEGIAPHMRADENASETAHYPIVSLYYDNEQRDCYWEKVRSIPSRRKMRVRVYGSIDGALAPTSFMEVKQKTDGRVVKRRARMPLEMALAIGAGETIEGVYFSENDRRVIDEVHRLVHQRNFRPSCYMRYDRHAYAAIDPESDLRITFDTDIAYRFDNMNPVPDDRDFVHQLLPPDFSVLEVKVTGAAPYWLTHLVGRVGCILQSHSKYCNAMEDGDPILHRQMGGRIKIQYATVPPLAQLQRVVVKHRFDDPGYAAAS